MKRTTNNDEAEACAGFKVIKWKVSAESQITHEFFVRGHDVSEPHKKKPIGRTALVLNVPPYLSRGNLKHMFSVFGKVVEVFVHQKPTSGIPPDFKNQFFSQEKDIIKGYRVAYIVYQDPNSLTEILQVDTDEIEPIIMGKTRCGLQSWISTHNSQMVDSHLLEESVKKFMTQFEKTELRRKAAEKQAGVADDEGWVTVTPLGKRANAGTKRTETVQERLKSKKRRMEKAILNLTPAQIKETKARQLEELKKKFDEDKQKVALLKQQRKFKPF